MLRSANASRIPPAHGATYPRGRFGESMRQIAQLIRADVGVEIAFADMEGWDTHVAQGKNRGSSRCACATSGPPGRVRARPG